MAGRRLLVDVPGFFYVNRRIRFQHGGQQWTDGFRTVQISRGDQYTCVPGSEEYPGCQQCERILGNVRFRVVSTYESRSGTYVIAVVHDVDPSKTIRTSLDGDELKAGSKLAEDQELFLRVVDSIREDSRVANHGTLFLGGNRLQYPYVITNVDGRLVVNGYALPDIIPPHDPALDAELETRRGVRAGLEAMRDSLRAAGVAWAETVAVRARGMPFVDSVFVSKHKPANTAKPGTSSILVKWRWGYQYLYIHESSSYSMGSQSEAWEQTEEFFFRRADRLREQLEAGNVVFLLGGGSEVVVPSADGNDILQGVEQLLRNPSMKIPTWMPDALRDQILNPLSLQNTAPEGIIR